MVHENQAAAHANYTALSRNPYPGRGIVVGVNPTSDFIVQVYWIMGRSEKSRNRVFRADHEIGRVYTELANPVGGEDKTLIIYNAMRESKPYCIVSNGDQTDTVADAFVKVPLHHTLRQRVYEPDEPNFTPRITAVSSFEQKDPTVQMSILRKSAFGDRCDRLFYELTLHPGFGYCITTYSGDGNPLPSFRGEPLIMPMEGDIEEVADYYWNALNSENRVSLVVKFIERSNGQSNIHIMNQYTQQE